MTKTCNPEPTREISCSQAEKGGGGGAWTDGGGYDRADYGRRPATCLLKEELSNRWTTPICFPTLDFVGLSGPRRGSKQSDVVVNFLGPKGSTLDSMHRTDGILDTTFHAPLQG